MEIALPPARVGLVGGMVLSAFLDLNGATGYVASRDFSSDAEAWGELDVEVSVGSFLFVPISAVLDELGFHGIVEDLAEGRFSAVRVDGRAVEEGFC